jgi:hypothetical protein
VFHPVQCIPVKNPLPPIEIPLSTIAASLLSARDSSQDKLRPRRCREVRVPREGGLMCGKVQECAESYIEVRIKREV